MKRNGLWATGLIMVPRAPPAETWPWWRKTRLALEDRGVSKEQYARAIKRNPVNVRNWLSGKNTPKDPSLMKDTADYLGWTVSYLLDEKQPYGAAGHVTGFRKMAEDLPPRVARFIEALEDPDVLAYCLSAYEHFESARQRERQRSTQPQRPGSGGRR